MQMQQNIANIADIIRKKYFMLKLNQYYLTE